MSQVSALDGKLARGEPHFWVNPYRRPAADAFTAAPSPSSIAEEAERDWRQFEPLLARLFPELALTGGAMVSPLLRLEMNDQGWAQGNKSRVLLKADHLLPLTGTIKARGGVYEVLKYAQRNALKSGVLSDTTPLAVLASPKAKAHFSRFRIVTGSTGNLGYSVAIAARALGFNVEIHLSSDAKTWKVERLRALGVEVLQHPGDFSAAVAAAREASKRKDTYFIDDEDSLILFQGYSAAAFELARQLQSLGIDVSAEHPLIVYMPCGVGGSPGGVAFGLKHLFADHVYCVFVEPVASPSVLLQVAAGQARSVSVYEFGLSNKTVADGMAVPCASMLVVMHVRSLVDAFATVDDASLLQSTRELWLSHGHRLEPSASAGYQAFRALTNDPRRPSFFEQASHVVWTTGGSQLPDEEFDQILRLAESNLPR